jgi:type IV pilus assembly protein PilA
MKKLIQNKLKNQKGLTLIELLAVIVILAIIAAIAIPAIGNIIENSRYSAVKADAQNVLSAANIYYTENPAGPMSTATPPAPITLTVQILKDNGYMENEGNIPLAATIAKNTEQKALGITTASPIVFSGTKSIKFTGATIKGINLNATKGSDVTTETISN